MVTVRETGPEYWIRNTQTHIGMLTKMNVHLKKRKAYTQHNTNAHQLAAEREI